MTRVSVVNIGRQFSRFPAGRYAKDGPASGEEFREKVLRPLLDSGVEKIRVELDDALGYGSSFLEEAFGGLVRVGYRPESLMSTFEFVSDDFSLNDEIQSYIRDAARHA